MATAINTKATIPPIAIPAIAPADNSIVRDLMLHVLCAIEKLLLGVWVGELVVVVVTTVEGDEGDRKAKEGVE